MRGLLLKCSSCVTRVFELQSNAAESSNRASDKGDAVLRTWDVESSHNYDNNTHTSQQFFCPGATSFVVEFDSRCETERRYDYLEFTDATGTKRRCV